MTPTHPISASLTHLLCRGEACSALRRAQQASPLQESEEGNFATNILATYTLYLCPMSLDAIETEDTSLRYPYWKWNFVLLLSEAIFFMAGAACIDVTAVIPVFLNNLTDSTVVIGAVLGILPLKKN